MTSLELKLHTLHLQQWGKHHMTHRRSRFVVAGATATLVLLAAVGSALAASPDVHPGSVVGISRVVSSDGAGTMTLVPIRGVAKDAWDPRADAASIGADPLSLGTYDVDG